MLNIMEELTNELTSKEFCRSHRVGDSVLIMQKLWAIFGDYRIWQGREK